MEESGERRERRKRGVEERRSAGMGLKKWRGREGVAVSHLGVKSGSFPATALSKMLSILA